MLFLVLVFIQSVSSIDKPCLTQLTQPIDHAEGPSWDNRTGLLYYVDIQAGGLQSYDLNTNVVHTIKLKGNVTLVVPSRSDPHLFIVGLNRSVTAVQWDGRRGLAGERSLTVVAKDKPTSRFNDGKADKKGRLWFGTMGYEDEQGNLDINKGALYLITRKDLANPEVVLAPLNISNGLAWNKANNKFFHIDTPTGQVKEYDYDNEAGKISNPRVAFDISAHPTLTGNPDGMTIDKDDNIWVALYGGGAVVKVDPKTNTLLEVIAMPARYVTSVCWGGPKLDILFVTTSRVKLSEEERRYQPAAGSVFGVKNLKTYGLPAFTADIIDKI